MSKRYRDYSDGNFSVPVKADDVVLLSRELTPGNFTSEGGTVADLKTFTSRWEAAGTTNFIRTKDDQGIVATFCVVGGDVTPQGLLHVHQVTLDEPLLRVLPDDTLIQSTADSGVSALVFSVNSVNAWTAGSLLAAKNAGVEKARIRYDGAYIFGRPEPSDLTNAQAGVVGRRNITDGDSALLSWYGQVDQGTTDSYGFFEFDANGSDADHGATFKLGSGNTDGTHTSELTIESGTTSSSAPVQLTWEIDAANRLVFAPTVANSGAAVAYSFDTHNTLSTTAKLAVFKNRGVEKNAIDCNGHVFIGQEKVVGARVVDARIDDTINSGDATTDGVIEAIRTALIAHGLIAAA